MRVLIAAGGTAGHVNPALAIAGEIERQCPGAEIHFAGRKKGMEYALVTKAGYPFHHIEVNGIQRRLTPRNVARNVQAVYHLALSAPRAAGMLRRVQPDLVIGAGGYVSGPVVQTAAKRGILTAIHEQNAFPGITNKILAKSVDLVFAAMPDAVDRLGPTAKGKTFVVGNPVRPAMWNTDRAAARKALGVKEGQIVIVSFGGSLGAQRLNEAVAQLAVWELKERDFLHIHATGSIEKNDFAVLAKQLGINADPRFQIREYLDDMPAMLAAADLVISRAGALTLAEISAVGRAAVLIPSPNVAENHQYYNAMQLENLGAARVLEEKKLTDGALVKLVDEMTRDKASLMEMGAKARALAQPDSLQKIWSHLEHLLKTGKP